MRSAVLVLAFATIAAAGDEVRMVASFEDGNPFDGDAVALVADHATDGAHALRIGSGFAAIERPLDFSGYDYLKADLYSDAKAPIEAVIELRDTQTTGYYSRVNYTTAVSPGKSELLIPLKELFVGEKAKPGRPIDLAHLTRFVLAIPGNDALYVDRVRLERDDSVRQALFDGLRAFDFGTPTSPVMEGFERVSPETLYAKERGFGLLNARVWRAFDVLQPDPLYQDFVCIEGGEFAVDVPNGEYTVVMNLDNASGYWGEYQVYRERHVTAEGRPAVDDAMDFEGFRKRYFRYWDTEDTPRDDVFAKYQLTRYGEKRFDVAVADGQLNLGFRGDNFACSVASIIVFPKAKTADGDRFLKFVEDRRRFHFETAFKRVIAAPTGDPVKPTAEDAKRGFVWSAGDWMAPPHVQDTPRAADVAKPLVADAFAGEYEPALLVLTTVADVGALSVSAGDLKGPGGTIPADRVDVAYVSQRIARSNMEGSIYTIGPRLLLPKRETTAAKGETRSFWLTVRVPADAKPGEYAGVVTVTAKSGGAAAVPLRLRVRAGTLDPVDVPAGPWGHTIDLPWNGPETGPWNERVTQACLAKLHEYGFTTFSGLPYCTLRGFVDGKPDIDFSVADAQMKRARAAGFTMPVVSYCGFGNLNLYAKDEERMRACGFTDYVAFIKAVFTAIEAHAREQDWLPVYWNVGDEPGGDDLVRACENAEALRQAFPQGPPFFTAACSFAGDNAADPEFRFAKALHVADWNLHDEASVNLLHQAGGDWAFYNGGSRWTFGEYLFKAAKRFGLKFRISWHWNASAGDPYYGLDCREDDFAWCVTDPDGHLFPTIDFEHKREGLDDYRRLLTLDRLARAKASTPAGAAARKLIDERMARFHLNDRDHDAKFGHDDWRVFRAAVDDAIEALR